MSKNKKTMEDWFLRGGTRPSEDELPEPPEEIEIPTDDDDDDDGCCPECSACLDGDEEVCPVCGEPLRQFCGKCGGENPPDETECTHCGARLTALSDEIYGVDNDGEDDGEDDADCPDCVVASPGSFGPLWGPW